MEKELEEAKAEIERLKHLEEENKKLTQQTESLNSHVLVLQEKCSNAEKEAKFPKDSNWVGDGLLEELEDKLKKAEDELKWKIEQFKHLEEAHEKLRDQFNLNRSEWEKEKSSLLDEISKLQESLDVECSTAQAGEDGVVNLRHSLRVKEMECKDLEYKAKKLETENRDLLASIKELQEAHIPKASTPQSSWIKLRNKLKNLEQTHKDCSANLMAKEAEWSCRAQRMSSELTRCSSSLKVKDHVIDQLKKELEDYHSSLTQLKMQNEELSLMLQLMKSENSEAISEQQRSREHMQEMRYSLGRVDLELVEKINERKDLELEVHEWKSLALRLKEQLEGSHTVRRELEESLLEMTEMEELLKQDVEDKNQRISNLQQQIMLIDQEIMIREDDNIEVESTSQRSQIIDYDDEDDDETYDDGVDEVDKKERRLLAKELEGEILEHILEEKRCTDHVEDLQHIKVRIDEVQNEEDEVSSAKENEIWQPNTLTKTGESIIEERSPFRVLN